MNSIYIHIPFCASRCAYCDFYSTTDNGKQKQYIKAVKSEIAAYAKIKPFSTVDTLYIGGGTPSLLYSGAISEILEQLKRGFDLQIKEFTVECNPDSFNEAKAFELKDCGVNRVSIGVQSLNQKSLNAVNRIHSIQQAKQAIKLSAKHFNVSADLILGLPYQEKGDITDFIEFINGEGVKHFSAYELSLEQGTVLKSKVEQNILCVADDDRLADLYDFTLETAAKYRYHRYEVSNFCVDGFESKHNYGYWSGAKYIGIGAAAAGFLGDVRYKNVSDISKYIDMSAKELPIFESQKLDKEELLYERIILGLRTEKGINIKQLERDFCINFEQKYAKTLQKTGKYLTKNGDFLCVKPQFFNVLNQILVNF